MVFSFGVFCMVLFCASVRLSDTAGLARGLFRSPRLHQDKLTVAGAVVNPRVMRPEFDAHDGKWFHGFRVSAAVILQIELEKIRVRGTLPRHL